MRRALRFSALLICCVAAESGALYGHDPGLSSAEIRLPGQGRLEVALTFAPQDILSLAAIDADADGSVAAGEVEAARRRLEALAMEMTTLSKGAKRLAADAASAHFSSDRDGDNLHLRVSYRNLEPGGGPLVIHMSVLARLARGHRLYATLLDGGETIEARLLDANNDAFELDPSRLSAGRESTFGNFFVLGLEHILEGYDHLLFLLAFLVVGIAFKDAVKIITAFTLAHSLTLTLATFDWFRLPAGLVEPLIAASIVYVGFENLVRRNPSAHRWSVASAFGLVHGLGFASALREIGVGAGGEVVLPLVSFNIGVEAGQLAVMALVLPAIHLLRQRPALKLQVARACSVLVAAAGLFWLADRIL